HRKSLSLWPVPHGLPVRLPLHTAFSCFGTSFCDLWSFIVSCLLECISRLYDLFLLETVPDQLQSDRHSILISAARKRNSRKSCQIDRNRINISQIHLD